MSAVDLKEAKIVEPAQCELSKAFYAQRAAFNANSNPTYHERLSRLKRLKSAIEKYEHELIEAMSADFGHRSPHESGMLDIILSIGDIKENIRHLKGWMKPRRGGTRIHLLPARTKIHPQPLGVAGIIAPWNFPVYLAITGASVALAAGNRVMIKPSELTPKTSELMAKAIAEFFDPLELTVINGDAEVGRTFSALPFDHILFTGSTSVGRHVAMAAAKNLTPVTLELGGKSPAIVTPSGKVAHAAEKIVYGKMVNAGQICVSPDYAMLPRKKIDDFIEVVKKTATKFYPSLAQNQDYTSIITDRHYQRLTGMIDDAREKGATVIQINPGDEQSDQLHRKIPLTLVINPTDNMQVMREEIFGPILPVIAYDELDQAINHINAGDRPLALYIFSHSSAERDKVLRGTISGGVTVNDTLWHVANDTLPFGGVGASGMGAYHGKAGFDTFSKLKPVFYQSGINAIPLFYPPYGSVIETVGKVVRKII